MVRVWLRVLVAALPVRVRMSGGVVEALPDEDVLVVELEPSLLLLLPDDDDDELVGVATADGPVAVSPPAPPPAPVKTRTPSSVVSCADIGLL